MAAKITEENYMNVQLLSADGQATRIIRIDNPTPLPEVGGRDTVVNALAPVLFPTLTGTTDVIPFFYDDNDESIPMTQIGDIEQISIEKSVKRLNASE